MSDIDELDINPFFKALQSKFSKIYEKAQEDCNVICIPQSFCLQGASITQKLVLTHILRPSPFFAGQYTTLLSHDQTVTFDDTGEHICMEDGFPTKSKVRIVNEELGYNKEYKAYKMLIIDRPLDLNIIKKDNIDDLSGSGEFKLKYTLQDCTEFLQSFAEFSKHLKYLDSELWKFNNNYILLKDYLEDAADRLQDITCNAAQECSSSIQNKQFNKHQNKDVLCTAMEIYEDRKDAREVCDHLRIPFYKVNFVKEYWNKVFSSFINDLQDGRSPNPDILCNKYLELNAFHKYAMDDLGADAVALGHYVSQNQSRI